MYVRQKFSLCLFSQKKLILSVSHHFWLVFGQKTHFFWLKIAYIDGKQTNKKVFSKNDKFQCFRCFFIPWMYQKLHNWKIWVRTWNKSTHIIYYIDARVEQKRNILFWSSSVPEWSTNGTLKEAPFQKFMKNSLKSKVYHSR